MRTDRAWLNPSNWVNTISWFERLGHPVSPGASRWPPENATFPALTALPKTRYG